jgi:glycosyltransferase involved in cell wall biosynthesis
MNNILKNTCSIQLPYPSTVIKNPDELKPQNFIQKTADLLDYGISWSIPGWDIQKMSWKIDRYYNFSFGFAEIPEYPESKQTVAACVLTFNSESIIELCLSSLKNFVDEIVVLDSGSTDNTLEIAKKYTSKCYQNKWPGDYSFQRNISLELIDTDWLLVIDSDEFMDNRAPSSIRKLMSAGEDVKIDVFWFGRKWISRVSLVDKNVFGALSYTGHYCFWNDSQPRLFKMNTAPHYEGIIHNLLFCEKARNSALVIEESVFINHDRIIFFSQEERQREVNKRNIVDPGNVHNLQLLPEKYNCSDNSFHQIHFSSETEKIFRNILTKILW